MSTANNSPHSIANVTFCDETGQSGYMSHTKWLCRCSQVIGIYKLGDFATTQQGLRDLQEHQRMNSKPGQYQYFAFNSEGIKTQIEFSLDPKYLVESICEHSMDVVRLEDVDGNVIWESERNG